MSSERGKTLGVPELMKQYRLPKDLAVIVARVTSEDTRVYEAIMGKLGETSFYDGAAGRAIKYLRTLR